MSALDAAARQLEPGTLVKMFVLDLTVQGGGIYRFHPYTNLVPNTILFQGETYVPFPITDEGWDLNTKGTLPKPIISASNIGGFISELLRLYGDFVGCAITRKRTYSQFLDGAAEADPTAEFTPEQFVIDRRKTENNTIVQFELTSPFDAQGILLPRRQIIANFCQWLYRGADCTYAGPPVADDQDRFLTIATDLGSYNSTATYSAGDYVYVLIGGIRQYYVSLISSNTQPLTNTAAWARDLCAKKINSCRLRFGGAGTISTTTYRVAGITDSHSIHGTGYVVGDILTAIGGVFTTPVTVEVLALGVGPPTDHVASQANGGFQITDFGVYTVIPPNPVYFFDTSGGGTGFALYLGWEAVVSSTTTGGVLPTGAFPGAAKVVA